MLTHRAGFNLSRALFRKKCVPFNWGSRPYFSWKKLATFFCSSLSFSLGGRPFFRHAKNYRSFCRVPFCGASVRPNMLNMPKYAADDAVN